MFSKILPEYLFFIVIFSLLFISSCSREIPNVLVFSKTAGFHHESIPDGIAAIQKLGEENGFRVDTTTNAAFFNEENLQNYAAVVFLNTTGGVLNHYQKAAFERYIQAGGGFAGIHSATDTEYHWGWYNRLVGAYFLDHPPVQEAVLDIVNKQHLSTRHLPDQWIRTDEWYSFRDLNENVTVLITLDENTVEGGTRMGYRPVSWYHDFDGGRSFYTALGHTSESYSEKAFLQHLLGGIRYAIGRNRKRDYTKASTERVPPEYQFVKTPLVTGEFFEPTEMTILPNLDVLITQRRGEILLYKHEDSTLSEVGFLDVYYTSDAPGVNPEEGVLGIQADPNFNENGYVFIFYSPADTSVNRLSRFVFENDVLNMDSEVAVLEFYSDRHICCHTGGSIAFDAEGLLYLSTGDNATPFNQPGSQHILDGYAPIDERPGFEQYDARRTSGNSNDLRGKIIRIQVNDDGTYDIPDGNLYPQGMEKTRPEIYVQGTRNAYRISVDQKTGFLYWGDVGPDAVNDSIGVRGPRGYDEFNQAREAGHFGWPFFVGDNYPYNEFDFNTGTPGPVFDPERPINRSPNNTGIRELPPAQPAFIWYPYSVSDEFPELGSGGRTAMAGPVFNSSLYPDESRLPDYLSGKLFIYEWMRDWIKLVTMTPEGDYDRMEPFMDSTTFNAIMDMEIGPDGKLYLLEYGKGWFTKNPDSGLSRIDYNPEAAPRKLTDVKTTETAPEGHQTESEFEEGRSLVATLDCRACHHTTTPSIGPTYIEIARLYHNTDGAAQYLSDKIIQGGSGVWGEVPMSAHPELSEEDAGKMVEWILSLDITEN